jgi:hypothetical protein
MEVQHRLPRRFHHSDGRVLSAPAVCPLHRTFGRRVECTPDCAYYRVPEVRTECAIEQWAPAVSRQPELAKWFLARR